MVSEPARILLLGDTHGNLDWCQRATMIARQNDCNLILQVGDFGYWVHQPGGRRFLDELETDLSWTDLSLLWIDGNHENFDLLRAIAPRDDGLVEIRPHVLHIPRGHRWTWGGLRFLGIGGAASIDMHVRTVGESWWPEESLTDTDVEHAVVGGSVDIVVSHDAPALLPVDGLLAHEPSQENRRRLQTVVDAVTPRLLVHGHLHRHHDKTITLATGEPVRVIGLNCDGVDQSMLILDLAEFAADQTVGAVI